MPVHSGNQLRMRSFKWSDDTRLVTTDGPWAGILNATVRRPAGAIIRARMHIERANPSLQLTSEFGLWYSKNGGADVRITASSANIQSIASAHYANFTPNLNLLLESGTKIDDNNGMHVSGGDRTQNKTFPASPRRFESEWALIAIPGDVATGDGFVLTMKRDSGTEFQLSPFARPALIIVEGGVIDGEGNIGATVSGSGEIAAAVSGQGAIEAAVRGSGIVQATVQGEGYLGPAVKGSGIIRPEGS